MYIDELADIVNKYNYTYHSSIKVKPIDIKSSTNIDFNNKNNKGNPKFKVPEEYWNIIFFWQKAMLQIGVKKFF